MNRSTDRREPSRIQTPGMVLAAWLVVAVLFLVSGGLALTFARSASADGEAANQQLVELEVIALRNRLTWIHYDLLIEGLIATSQRIEMSPDRIVSFRSERTSIIDELGVLAASDGPGSAAASELVEISSWDTFGDWPYSPESLDNQHYSILFADRSSAPKSPWSQHNDAAARSMLAPLVLVDALSVAATKAGQDPDAWGAEFRDYTFETVTDAPGWFGPDRDAPLVDNFVSGPGSGDPAEETGQRAPTALAELQQVWDYDQWLINNADQGFVSEPPMSIEQLGLVSSVATAALRDDALDAIADDVDRITASGPGSATATVWYGVGGAAMILALLAFGVVFSRLLGGHRKLAETALTDALTGVRNRRYLDTEVAGRCGRAECNHLIVMVDLDRFKLINDTWGHDAGDALLRLLSSRLEEVVAALARAVPGLTGAVVRPGGDEFIVAIHSAKDISAITLEERLRAITGPVDLGRDELIDLQFSLGIACAYGAVDLADLVKAADLAAYEDKRQRADARMATVEMSESEVIEIL